MAWKRIVGYIRDPLPRPTDPDYGIDEGGGFPVDPGFGGGRPPVDPGYGMNAGLRPSNELPKPPGFPILPPTPDNGLPPTGHPWLPGHWVPVDPGFGLPPVFGFKPVDPGFGIPVPPPTPGNSLPGHWVPINGKPDECPGTKPIKPVWVWIPEIGPDFGLKPQPK